MPPSPPAPALTSSSSCKRASLAYSSISCLNGLSSEFRVSWLRPGVENMASERRKLLNSWVASALEISPWPAAKCCRISFAPVGQRRLPSGSSQRTSLSRASLMAWSRSSILSPYTAIAALSVVYSPTIASALTVRPMRDGQAVVSGWPVKTACAALTRARAAGTHRPRSATPMAARQAARASASNFSTSLPSSVSGAATARSASTSGQYASHGTTLVMPCSMSSARLALAVSRAVQLGGASNSSAVGACFRVRTSLRTGPPGASRPRGGRQRQRTGGGQWRGHGGEHPAGDPDGSDEPEYVAPAGPERPPASHFAGLSPAARGSAREVVEFDPAEVEGEVADEVHGRQDLEYRQIGHGGERVRRER